MRRQLAIASRHYIALAINIIEIVFVFDGSFKARIAFIKQSDIGSAEVMIAISSLWSAFIFDAVKIPATAQTYAAARRALSADTIYFFHLVRYLPSRTFHGDYWLQQRAGAYARFLSNFISHQR